jgi:hypothetical protein
MILPYVLEGENQQQELQITFCEGPSSVVEWSEFLATEIPGATRFSEK